jgi:hypothetical protein
MDAIAGRGRGWLLAVALLGAGTAAVDATRYASYLIDDTFISFRYARNWVDGRGLVFNAGERVEGYTNFSFVALAALAMRVGIDPVRATKALSVVAALATLCLVAWMGGRGCLRAASADGVACQEARPLGEPTGIAIAAVLLLLPLQAFTYWAVASFETMLFTALLTAATTCLMRERATGDGNWSAVLFVALALTRPEGALLAVVANGAFAIVDLGFPPRLTAAVVLRRYGVKLLLFSLCFGAYTAWRWSYYGRLLPNTFYAKVTGDAAQLATGARQLGEWALEYPLPALTLLLPLGLLSRAGRGAAGRAPVMVAVYLITATYSAYVVLVGGDFMPFFRFNVPVLPLQCLLLAWMLRSLPRLICRFALPAAILVNLVASHLGEQPYRAFVAHRTTVVGEQVGAWLHDHLQSDDLIALNTAGAVPYASGLPALDMLGLTDAAIAERPVYVVSTGWAGHRRGWGAYVIERRPAVILWYNSAGLREPHYLSDRELADNPYFRFFYAPRRVALPAAPAPAGTPLARFLGAPFGGTRGRATSGDLGMAAEVVEAPVEHTALTSAPIEVNYFALARRDAVLWPLAETSNRDVQRFVDDVAAVWAAAPAPPPAREEDRLQVEALCEEARQAVAAGDHAAARTALDQALRRNATVHSPLVYQYVANLAVLTGDLFTAVGAQKEALRLAPANALYRRNLVRLLAMPFASVKRET